jgi:hypothetical protein
MRIIAFLYIIHFQSFTSRAKQFSGHWTASRPATKLSPEANASGFENGYRHIGAWEEHWRMHLYE